MSNFMDHLEVIHRELPYDIVKDLPFDQQRLIMGESLEKVMRVGQHAG